MKPLSSVLLFPETEPSIHDIEKLLFFFNPLTYYLPTETDIEDKNRQNLLTNLCSGYVPAPLHEDLSRFNRLLREMENSRPDDLARLFSTAASPIATGQIRDKDEASSGSVLSAMQNDNGNKAHARHKERLWQARLILKLAEMLYRREREVRQGLALISSDEQKNFASLEGLSETESADPAQIADLEKFTQLKDKIDYPADYSMGASSMLIPLRVKAWAELFLADSSPNRPFTLVTSSPDSGSTLLDGYENAWGKTAQKLFSLSIPTFPGINSSKSATEHYVLNRNKFRLAAEEELQYFESILRETAVLQNTATEKFPEISLQPKHAAAWEEKINLEFPVPATDFQKLDFYCFPGISSSALFQRIFHLEPLPVNQQEYTTSILAILHA